MSSRNPSNIPASIAARVRNWATANERTFQHALNRYATERFFARLEASEFAERLVLKGGNLLVVWFSGKDYRPTMDTDFLYCGRSMDENEIYSAFKSICRTRFPEDGILFDETSIEVEPIREDTKYGGQRVTLKAYIGNIRVPLQFDIGFGDAVTPSPEKVEYPAMLDFPSPKICAYPMATAVAEKCAIMVELGFENSRMKDYHNVWTILNRFDISDEILRKALRRTFARRGTITAGETPLCFTKAFADDPKKAIQWRAYLKKNQIGEGYPAVFAEVAAFVSRRLIPLLPRAKTIQNANASASMTSDAPTAR